MRTRPSSWPTTRPTAWPERCGPRTCTAPTGWRPGSKRAPSGSTPTASSLPRCPSAGSSIPVLAGRTASVPSTSTSRKRRSGSSSPAAPATPSPSAKRRSPEIWGGTPYGVRGGPIVVSEQSGNRGVRMPDTAFSLVTSHASEQRTGRVTLLERKTALDALAELASQARSGDGRLVMLEGEAGVGKSALLEQFTGELPDSRLLSGACDGMFTPRPLGPLFDIAQQVHGRLHSLCRADASREQLFDALLTELCEPGPLPVVVIEDVHWADESTLDLLGFLARRIREIAVLLIVSYRNDELAGTHPLRVALGYLAVQRWTSRLSLAPLSARAVRTLAAGRGVDPVELHRITGGNPFYLHAVLEAGLGQVPGSARDVVLARAARLDPR